MTVLKLPSMATMAEENTFTLHPTDEPSPRPPLNSHHSNSVPTTPFSRERTLSFGGRSPSPKNHDRNGSPRSIHSMAENGFRSKAPSFVGCPFETGLGFSKRRIPYSVGGDPLERTKAPPKKFLSREQDTKLTGDMRELYDRLLPTPEDDERRATFVRKLDRILNDQWSGNEIKVHVFGSSGNLLCTNDSDVDICITTNLLALEKVCLLAKALADHGMERVVCVRVAKVPIVKFWDPELQLACDMNVNNTLALENTRMIKTYVEIDERVRPLAMIIKHWTKRRILNDAAFGGTLSSYTWICMILNFLQTRNPPILPSLHKRPHARRANSDKKIASFNEDLSQLRGHGQNNKESIGELLFNFFRRYAHDLDYEKHVVSVREGRLISKEAKKWHLMQNNRLCVEEPFNTDRNLGNTTDDISFRGIHCELRRAFDLVAEAQLGECLEQYEFPANEEKIWEKPAAKPAPVLRSRSQSQSSRPSRGPYTTRGPRHGQYKSNNRRASSAAATNKYPLPPNEANGFRGRDTLFRDQQTIHAQEQAMALHHHLFLEMQHLHDEEQRLRMLQAQAQHVQMREGGERGLPPNYSSREPSLRPPAHPQISLSTPLRSGQFYPSLVYPQVPGTPIQSIHTQPSSPSMKSAQPDLRRTLHRSSGAESTTASSRSHSQPARTAPVAVPMQGPTPIPLSNQSYLQYQQQLRQQQQQLYGFLDPSQSRLVRPDSMMYQYPNRLPFDFPFEENVPKEYVGYWMNDASSPSYQYKDESGPFFAPPYQDLYPGRMRGIPPNIDRLRRNSRSPSPSTSLPFRDRSHSIRSASSAPIGAAYPQMPQTLPRNGPIIVNGTDGWTTSEYLQPEYLPLVDSSSHTTISEATSGSEEQQFETPTTGEMDTPFNGSHPDDGFGHENHQPSHHQPPQATQESQRMPSFARKANADSSRQRGQGQGQNHDSISQQASARRPEKSLRPAGGLGIQFGDLEIPTPSKPETVAQEQPRAPAASSSKAEASPATSKSEHFEKLLAPVPLLSPVREVRTPSPVGKRAEDGHSNQQRGFGKGDGKMDLRIPTFAELVRMRQEKQEKQKNGVASMHNTSGAAPSSKLAETAKAQSTSPAPSKSTGAMQSSSKAVSTSHAPHPITLSKPTPMPRSTSPQNKAQPPQPHVNGWQQQSSKKNRKNRSRPGSGQFPIGEPLPVHESERKGG